jgi:hypothetical protein
MFNLVSVPRCRETYLPLSLVVNVRVLALFLGLLSVTDSHTHRHIHNAIELETVSDKATQGTADPLAAGATWSEGPMILD